LAALAGYGSGSFLLAGASRRNSPASFQIESQLPERAHNGEANESNAKEMKRKHLFLAIAALVAAGGLWLARTSWRTHALDKSSMDVSVKMPGGGPNPGQMHQPPNPIRKFEKLTPEQRVQHARKGPIGG
jgi:hypothetical protein